MFYTGNNRNIIFIEKGIDHNTDPKIIGAGCEKDVIQSNRAKVIFHMRQWVYTDHCYLKQEKWQ